jgi:hypothetical protein
VPGQQTQIDQLQAEVNAGPFAATVASSTATTSETTINSHGEGAGDPTIVSAEDSSLQTPVPAAGAPFYVKQNDEWCDQYGQCIPANAFSTVPATSTADQDALAAKTTTLAPQEQPPEDPVSDILQIVQGWISDVVSIFMPNVATSAPQQCSLFKSLFGGCGGGW